jgi:hypothetical protein
MGAIRSSFQSLAGLCSHPPTKGYENGGVWLGFGRLSLDVVLAHTSPYDAHQWAWTPMTDATLVVSGS